jgi:hypothetical protein
MELSSGTYVHTCSTCTATCIRHISPRFAASHEHVFGWTYYQHCMCIMRDYMYCNAHTKGMLRTKMILCWQKYFWYQCLFCLLWSYNIHVRIYGHLHYDCNALVVGKARTIFVQYMCEHTYYFSQWRVCTVRMSARTTMQRFWGHATAILDPALALARLFPLSWELRNASRHYKRRAQGFKLQSASAFMCVFQGGG